MYMRPNHRYASPRSSGALRRRQARGGGRRSLGDVVGSAVSSVISPFPASVEAWRDLFEQYAGDIPVPFLLAWAKKESNGNPCSYTTFHESGISQLMAGDNQNVAGTSEAELHPSPPCTPGIQTTAYFESLTPAQQVAQVVPFIRYVNYARNIAHTKLAAAGVDWGEDSPDFWRVVKLVFNYPGPIVGWLQGATAALGHPPTSWDEMRSTITGYASVLDNAEYVGGFAATGISSPTGTRLIVMLGVGALAVWWLTRNQGRSRFAL